MRKTTKTKVLGAVIAAVLSVQVAASAATVTLDVFAKENALKPTDTALATGVVLSAGEAFSVSAAVDDFWSLGPTTSRSINADGDSEATGAPVFGTYSDPSSGQAFLFGQLIGRIDNGDYFALGADFSGIAGAAGQLYLLSWDANDSDNSGSISVTITTTPSAVPLPASALLLMGGLGALAAAKRKRRKQV